MSEIDGKEITKAYLKALGIEINRINAANGWDVPNMTEWSDPNKKWILTGRMMLVVTEVAEAVEAFRKDDPENFLEEMADIFIRLFSMVDGYQMDIIEEMLTKMAVNSLRAEKHGGKII